jgi:hypothetical protein
VTRSDTIELARGRRGGVAGVKQDTGKIGTAARYVVIADSGQQRRRGQLGSDNKIMTEVLNIVLEREGLTPVRVEVGVPVEANISGEDAVSAMARTRRAGICPACAHDARGDFGGGSYNTWAEFQYCHVCGNGYANPAHRWSKHNLKAAVDAANAAWVVRDGLEAEEAVARGVDEIDRRQNENKSVDAVELSRRAGVCPVCAYGMRSGEYPENETVGGGFVLVCGECENEYPNPANPGSTHNCAAAVAAHGEAVYTRRAEGLEEAAVAMVAMAGVRDGQGRALEALQVERIRRQVIEILRSRIAKRYRADNNREPPMNLCMNGGRSAKCQGLGWGTALCELP